MRFVQRRMYAIEQVFKQGNAHSPDNATAADLGSRLLLDALACIYSGGLCS